MSQTSFLGMEPKKPIRSQKFLQQMNHVVPWARLCKVIEPYYPPSKVGRPRTPLLLMLKIYCLQQWYNLSDPGAEEAIYDRLSFQQFLGLESLGDSVPDETTILNFRHLLEKHNLTVMLFDQINQHLKEHGFHMAKGSLVDATLISAPSSTKNTEGRRDPEMSSTKKGNQHHFGMKCHIGVDAEDTLVHHVHTTTASVHDSQVMDEVLRGDEELVFADKAYDSQEAKERLQARGTTWAVQKKARRGKPLSEADQKMNHLLSRVRCRVEHPFQVIKHLWGHRKVRYKGLYKNTCQFHMLFALQNLYRVREKLLEQT